MKKQSSISLKSLSTWTPQERPYCHRNMNTVDAIFGELGPPGFI